VAVQPDGKILLGGVFNTLQPNGAASATTRNNIARLNPDGTLDTGFNPKANGTVNAIALQSDGKVLLCGVFTTLQPNNAPSTTTRNRIARVNSDGTLDTSFNPNANITVDTMALQPDGKIVLGGVFSSLQPNGAPSATIRNNIARINSDGTLDTGFNPNSDGMVDAIAVQPDGKVIFGGFFSHVQPNGAPTATVRNSLARVNSDGTLDTGFDPNPNSQITSIALQADTKILLGGVFTTLRPNQVGAATTRNRLARVNADGTIDNGFNPNAAGPGGRKVHHPPA
jgi:uncharacterized delta-60 repeat protein